MAPHKPKGGAKAPIWGKIWNAPNSRTCALPAGPAPQDRFFLVNLRGVLDLVTARSRQEPPGAARYRRLQVLLGPC